MWVGRRVNDDGAPRERLDLVADPLQQWAVLVDRVELGRREFKREREEQSLRGGPVARQLAHHTLVQDTLVGRMLVHDGDA